MSCVSCHKPLFDKHPSLQSSGGLQAQIANSNVPVVAFVSAVIGATEAYFCSIKHKLKKIRASQILNQYISFDEPNNFYFEAYLANERNKLPNTEKN